MLTKIEFKKTRYNSGFFIDRMTIRMKLQKILFALLIFTIPSNLFKTFLENSAYVRGIRVDYLIPKLHLSDFVLIALLFILLIDKKNQKILQQFISQIHHKSLLVIGMLLLSVMQLTVTHPIISVLFLTKVIALGIIGIVISKNTQLLKSKATVTAINFTIIFQSLLAWYQYLFQKSFFGYYFLGETNLNAYAGIAQSTAFGVQKILPYGTTAHPNILAGILVVFSLFQLNRALSEKKYKRVNLVLLFLSISTILLTQSLSALLALTIGFATIVFAKKTKKHISLKGIGALYIASNLLIITILAFSLFKPNYGDTSTYRRAFLNDAAINMTANNLLTGVGLQNFTAHVEQYSSSREVVRFVQPAHNVFLLFISETGLLGITIALALLIPLLRKKVTIQHPEYLLALIPLLALDHYLITMQSGILLFFLCFLLSEFTSSKS